MLLKPKLQPSSRFRLVKQTLRIMNITAIILLSACLTSYAAGFSQKVTLSVKNMPVQQVFKEVSRQTGFSFIYNEAMFEKFAPVTIEVKDVSLDEALDICFRNQPFSYDIKDK